MKCVHAEQKRKREREKESGKRRAGKGKLEKESNEKSGRMAAYFLPLGLPLAYSHQVESVQASQAGLRAAHTRRPWKMIQ